MFLLLLLSPSTSAPSIKDHEEREAPSVRPSLPLVGRMVGGCRASGREQTSSALSLSPWGEAEGEQQLLLSSMWLLLLLPLLLLETAFPLLHCCQFSLPRQCARGREGRRRRRNFPLSKQLTKCSGEGRSADGRTDGREPNFFSQLSLPFSPLPFLPPLPPPKAQRKRGENQSRSERRRGSNDPQYIWGRGARKRSFGCCCCCRRCRCMRPLLLQPPPPWGLMR